MNKSEKHSATWATVAIAIVCLVMVCFAGGARGHDGSLQMHEAEGLNFWGGHEPELSITGTATTADLRLEPDFKYDPNSLISVEFWTVDEPTDLVFCQGKIEVLFTWTDGKFDVVYDANDLTGAAEAFFTGMTPYLNAHIKDAARKFSGEKK